MASSYKKISHPSISTTILLAKIISPGLMDKEGKEMSFFKKLGTLSSPSNIEMAIGRKEAVGNGCWVGTQHCVPQHSSKCP